MLVWINGPFGAGKTQTAHALQRRLPGSVVCDPEHIGFGLHRTMPAAMREDFQDLPAWRQGVFEVLDLVLTKQAGTVIAPMTVVNSRYFEQTVGRLRERGHEVRHFALLADSETIRRRLRERAFGRAVQMVAGRSTAMRRESFALSKLDECLERLGRAEFAEQIWTDRLAIEAVADRIAARAGLTLVPNTDSALHARVRQAWIGVKHIRLG